MKIIIGITLALVASFTAATEITVCIVQSKAKTPVYYNLPTTNTLLICDGFDELNKSPTMKNMYADGWKLLHVVPVHPRFKTSKNGIPFPTLIFERESTDGIN